MDKISLLESLVGLKNAKTLSKLPLGELFGLTIRRQNSLNEDIFSGVAESYPAAGYAMHPALHAARELLTMAMAEQVISADYMTNTTLVKDYLRLKLGGRTAEEFWVVFIDSKHGVIAIEKMFSGTINQAAVYIREIVKRSIHHNAASLILAHIHPSGGTTPSDADIKLTRKIQEAISILEMNVLDHIIVGDKCESFTELRLI